LQWRPRLVAAVAALALLLAALAAGEFQLFQYLDW
jgi:hypothetical protein